jgi:hypothetical protein
MLALETALEKPKPSPGEHALGKKNLFCGREILIENKGVGRREMNRRVIVERVSKRRRTLHFWIVL